MRVFCSAVHLQHLLRCGRAADFPEGIPALELRETHPPVERWGGRAIMTGRSHSDSYRRVAEGTGVELTAEKPSKAGVQLGEICGFTWTWTHGLYI